MTANDPPLKTTSEIGGIRAPGGFQAIDAKYYNITDRNGRPIAGLLVLMDRIQRPVRAELHLYDEMEDSLRESALRQSQLILQDRYYSREPVQLRVMHTFQERSAVNVPLPASGPAKDASSKSGGGINWGMIIGVILALVVVAAIVWGVSRFMDSRQTGAADTPAVTALASTTGDTATDSGANSEADPQPASAAPQTNGLEPSQNAHPGLAVGQTIRIRPGYQLALRSEPGADAGEDVAYMQDGEQVQIIGGPYWTQGNTDTIVWWQVQLADGTEAWAAANTSELTLLEPVE